MQALFSNKICFDCRVCDANPNYPRNIFYYICIESYKRYPRVIREPIANLNNIWQVAITCISYSLKLRVEEKHSQ